MLHQITPKFTHQITKTPLPFKNHTGGSGTQHCSAQLTDTTERPGPWAAGTSHRSISYWPGLLGPRYRRVVSLTVIRCTKVGHLGWAGLRSNFQKGISKKGTAFPNLQKGGWGGGRRGHASPPRGRPPPPDPITRRLASRRFPSTRGPLNPPGLFGKQCAGVFVRDSFANGGHEAAHEGDVVE